MSDGRSFTNYSPRCVRNFEHQVQPKPSYDYRMYLIHNAENLMKRNLEEAYKTNICGPCAKPSTMLPEQNVQMCDGRTCKFPVNDRHGLGLGRRVGGEEENYSNNPGVKITSCPRALDMNMY
jgi:hypothetical protein